MSHRLHVEWHSQSLCCILNLSAEPRPNFFFHLARRGLHRIVAIIFPRSINIARIYRFIDGRVSQ